MNSTTKLMGLLALTCAACGSAETQASPPPTTNDAGASGGDGGGGDGGGGDTGGTTSTTSTSTTCDPDNPTEAFAGYHGCWDVECCTGINPGTQVEMNYQCNVATGGKHTQAYLCAMAPTFGPQSDYRECGVITVFGWENATCQWGPTVILCCEPK